MVNICRLIPGTSSNPDIFHSHSLVAKPATGGKTHSSPRLWQRNWNFPGSRTKGWMRNPEHQHCAECLGKFQV